MTETFNLSLEQAHAYEDLFVPALFAQWVPTLLETAEVTAGQHVLDVACGTGVVARKAGEVVGPTASPSDARRLMARRPAAAVLDLALGPGTTHTLAQDLSAGGVPVVLVSSSLPEHAPPRLRGYPTLNQPFTPSALAGALLGAIA